MLSKNNIISEKITLEKQISELLENFENRLPDGFYMTDPEFNTLPTDKAKMSFSFNMNCPKNFIKELFE